MRLRLASSSCVSLALLTAAPTILADEATAPGPNEQQIETFLATTPASADVSKAPDAPEAPPPPPRRHGFVLESSIGAMGQLGALRHISPLAPWFRGAFGYEATHWLMLLVQGDITPSNTSVASPPPTRADTRCGGLSLAARFGVQPSRAVGLFVQGEVGLASITDDVLSTYGFKDADSVGPYFGGLAGVEWYQVSAHYALTLEGGARTYGSVLDRTVGNEPALAWIGAAGLKYTF